MKRKKLSRKSKNDNYFISDKSDLEFVSSGCQIIDCVLGGGYALGRMTNIIGDKSTAKTHLGGEAITNFLFKYPDGAAAYRDVEGAFEKNYARAMGIPVDQIDFKEDAPLDTIEDFQKDLDSFLNKQIKNKTPGIYVLDSFDALSDDAEMIRNIDKGTMGMGKSKKSSEIFRRLSRKIQKSRVLIIIVSQVRENINPMAFGEKYRRAGGKALDFYASQFLWLALAPKNKIKTTKKKVERIVGVRIRANCKKNKIGIPFRQCDFNFIFGYGVDDVEANLSWLKSVNRLDELGISESKLKAYINETNELSDERFQKRRRKIAKVVKRTWAEIETQFLPTRTKYSAST